jgi:hypothetical protein
MEPPERLSQFPYVRVRVRCSQCPHRRGDYSLARLAERYGAEARLEAVLYELTRTCKWQVPPETKRRQYVPYCHATFADLFGGREPDLPPDDGPMPPSRPRLRIVDGAA